MDGEALGRWSIRTFGGLCLLAALAGFARWASTPPALPELSIADQWTAAIARYGIEPAYPPQEDLAVGDVFVFITSDANFDLGKGPLPLRAIKVWHVDLSRELQDAYREGYQLFPTADPPPGPAAIWKQNGDDRPLFSETRPRDRLPLVALPDFEIGASQSASSDGGLGALASAFHVAGGGRRTLSIKLAGAETYGVSAVPAEIALNAFCASASYRAVCTDRGMRLQASMLIGRQIYETIRVADGSSTYRYEVELGMITRIYLIRSMETVFQDVSGLEGSASAGERPARQASKTPAATAAAAVGAETVERAAAGEGQPGVSIVVRRTGSSRIAETRTFERPIVIGYRSIRYRPN